MNNYLSKIKTIVSKYWKADNGIFKILTISLVFSSTVLSIIFYKYHFEQAGNIGDTIGGILGTIISVFAAWLVYSSFQSQVEANKQITKQLSDERIFNLYNIFNKELSDNITYKNINEKYQQYINTKNYSIKKQIIDETLFDLLINLKKEIEDNKMIFENSKVLFNSFKKLTQNVKDEYYKIFFTKMKESLKVYFDYLKNFENKYLLPIIKISNTDKILRNYSTFQISNFYGLIFKIKGVNIIDENEKNINTVGIELEIKNETDLYTLDVSDLGNINIKIVWEIEYSNKLYAYNNKETYQINNS